MNHFFSFGKFESRDFAVFVDSPTAFDAPIPETDSYSFFGNSGDVVFDRHRYPNIRLKYTLVIEAKRNIDTVMTKIRALLLSMAGYQRLEDSYNPTIYRMAKVAKNFIVKKRSVDDRFSLVELTFDAMPQRFWKDGDRAVEIDVRQPVAVPMIYNPTGFASSPLLRFVANAESGSIKAGKSLTTEEFLLEFSGVPTGKALLFDSQTLDLTVEEDGTFLNDKCYSTDTLLIYAGNNWFDLENIESLQVVPRWWEI